MLKEQASTGVSHQRSRQLVRGTDADGAQSLAIPEQENVPGDSSGEPGRYRPASPVARGGCLGGHPKPAIDGHLKTGHHDVAAETLTPARNACSLAGMSNVLGDDKQQQVLALGRLGWSLRRIEQATDGPPRDGERLSEGGRDPGARARRPAQGVAAKTGHHTGGVHRPGPSKPATTPEVSTDSGPPKPAISDGGVHRPRRPSPPGRAPSASACEPYRELIAEALGRGRNAMAIWQDLVDDHGFAARYASVRRFVVTLRGARAGRGARRDHHRPRRGRPSRLRRRWADGPRPDHRQVSPRAPLCAHAGLLAQVRAAADVAIERADLGRAPRAGVSPTGRHGQGHRARQPGRRRAHAGHLRSGAQSALSRRPRPLRRRRAAVPRAAIPIAKGKSKPASATRRRRR